MSHRSLGVRGLVAGYHGQPPVLTGVDLEIAPRSRLALLGANGSGKTTLLRCLSGSLPPLAGSVLLDGRPLRHTRGGLRRHRQEVQLVLQDPDDQLFSADVAQDVSFGPINLGLDAQEVRERVDEALELLGVVHLRDRATHHLSHGERKRVATAGAVAMRPCVLLLDEPTAGLDPAGEEEMLRALERLEAHGTTVVLSTHDVALALTWAHQVAVVRPGSLVAGAPEVLLADEELVRAARLRTPWPLALSARLAAAGLVPADLRPRCADELLDGLVSGA